jgi:hypothetical protein
VAITGGTGAYAAAGGAGRVEAGELNGVKGDYLRFDLVLP